MCTTICKWGIVCFPTSRKGNLIIFSYFLERVLAMRAFNSFFRQKNSKRGLSLSTVLVVCIVLSLLVAMLVSMASLNFNTTQVAVSQREAYIQAKSAISFAESFYSKNGDYIPGAGNTGEGLVVFKTNNIADGAAFYETKSGTNVLIDDATVQSYKDACPDTYIEVSNSRSSAGESVLTLNAVSKYGGHQAYTLAKEYTIGGHSTIKDNAFTGAINYVASGRTRYVRFHVRATTALGAAPYFYMWYNQISPPEFNSKGERNASYNAYARSSIVNKLSFNHAYSKVQNGSWGSDGPEGACAMSYEGGGWYVTQKTFNLNRNLNFVNGIITKTGSARWKGNDQQSWEFFGIPIPKDDELGESEGVDIYFEINQNKLRDMQEVDGKDEFSKKYQSFGGSGIDQLNSFVKYCGEWYTVYTKTDTAIVHYRQKGKTDETDGPGGFTYEGYGWWRTTSHNFDDSFLGYRFGNGTVISQNQFGKEQIRELFICQDGEDTAAFIYEEEANEWFVKHGDLSAGDYIEVNVRASGQPVDAEVATYIEYKADLYEQTEPVPVAPEIDYSGLSEEDTELDVTTLEGEADDNLEFEEVSDPEMGDYFLVGSMNGWQDGVRWNDLSDQLEKQGDGFIYTVECNVTPAQPIEFWIVQRPSEFYLSKNRRNRYTDRNPNLTYCNAVRGYTKHNALIEYTNYWGNGADPENDYKYSFIPTSDAIKITFDASSNEVIDVENIGVNVSELKIYSIVGWMNDWGKKQGDETSDVGLYSLTNEMSLYSNVDGILSYTEGALIVRTGEEYRFKIAERDTFETSAEIKWDQVYGKDGICTGAVGDEDAEENAILIKPVSPDGEVHRYIVSIMYDPQTKLTTYDLTELNDEENFYLVGEFNGWSSEDASEFEFKDATLYKLEETGADKNDIMYSYRLNSLQEEGTYEIKVISTFAEKSDGKVNYEYSWGEKISNDESDPKYLVTQGETAASKTYDLVGRGYVIINFTYHKNDPSKSEITFTTIPDSEIERVNPVYVGFHNDKLTNVNDHSKDSKFETPWEQVYVTYYTETTGFNCFSAKKDPLSENWWAKVPSDAEYAYFSNKKTNVYRQLHSEDFQYTENIPAAMFTGAKSTIFFPINDKLDDENRVYWTVGDSQLYNTYVNRVTRIVKEGADAERMAYYGSTQCNYYDAPIVNVLNMLVCGDPRPKQKYFFSSAPYEEYSGFNFSSAPTVSYQGETYYYRPQSFNTGSSVLIVQNAYATDGRGRLVAPSGGNKNGGTFTGYMYETDMSLQPGNVTYDRGYLSDRTSGGYYQAANSGDFLMDDRAGGMFVSDETYRNGDPSLFNYGGYTPSWYTFRIPVTSEVTLRKITGVTGAADVILSNDKAFEVVKQSQNVNRPIYIYKNAADELQSFTYNINQGVVDSNPKLDGRGEPTGSSTVSVYFDNDEGWSNVAIRAYSPIKESHYEIIHDDPTTDDNNYYSFTFDEGQYCFFQFFDSSDASEAGFEAATHKSSVLYFTGDETDRQTYTLCHGSATGFDAYMHPRIAVMRAYLDLDSVVQMTTDTAYYKYSKTQGVYHCYGEVKMSGLAANRNSLQNAFNNGNAGSGKWTAIGIDNVGDGLLEAATEFMNTVSQARIYVSDDVSNANSDSWAGTDPDQCMVFMEGEQLQNSAFNYTPRWKTKLKNVYKKIMLSSYQTTDEDNHVTGSVSSNPYCIWTNTRLQNAAQLRQYTADLKLWLDNPQMTIKPEAVRIIVDDTGKGENISANSWGVEAVNLYVKKPGTSEWLSYDLSDKCTTTQKNFYAFVFMFPEYISETSGGTTVQTRNEYWGSEFAIAPSQPDTNGMVAGVQVPTCTVLPGKQYRFNTVYYGVDDSKCFGEDTSTETKIYTGTDITQGDNSPTDGLNEMTGTAVGRKFIINFKYDTKVHGGGQSYTIFAGAYVISESTYPGFYSDFGGTTREDATLSGINLFTASAKTFFKNPATYGMISAKGYQAWNTNINNSNKDVDIMTSSISKTSTASAPGQTVNFRYNGNKGNDTLAINGKSISLTGKTVSIAVNKLDFTGAGSNDFTVDAKTIIFHTDTTVIRPDGKEAIIMNGTYMFNEEGASGKTTRVSLKSTNDQEDDWRNNYVLVSDVGTQLEGGKFVVQ